MPANCRCQYFWRRGRGAEKHVGGVAPTYEIAGGMGVGGVAPTYEIAGGMGVGGVAPTYGVAVPRTRRTPLLNSRNQRIATCPFSAATVVASPRP